METDYSEAGRNLVADLVSKWGGGWWGENVNKMDCLYTHPDTGIGENQARHLASPPLS